MQAFAIGDARQPRRQHLRFLRASVEGFGAWRLEQRGAASDAPLSPEAARWRDHLRTTALRMPAPRAGRSAAPANPPASAP